MTVMTEAPRLGFFGKVPARGDFVSRRLLRDFTDPWDAWLQDAIAMSSEQLAEAWLSTYLTAPIWRFLLAAGICGEAPMLGVMMPSVDRVGRYFPLTLAVALSEDAAQAKTFLGAASWFDEVEKLALSALEEDADLDRLDQDTEAIGPPDVEKSSGACRRSDRAVLVDLDGSATPQAPAILDGVLLLFGPRYSVWWTSGSERVKPSLVVAEGLPAIERFAALLDGRWEQWGWKTR
jgi:type VI secretion system protein ImpM